MSALAAASERWRGLAAEAEARLGAGEAPAAAALRRAGREAFAAAGLPSTRLEEWRYTNLSELAAHDWRLPGRAPSAATRDAVEALASPVFACGLVVFANGRFVPELGALRSPEVEVTSLAQARRASGGRSLGKLGALLDAKQHPLAALATALLDDGALIRLPAGAKLAQPLHLVFVSEAGGPPLAAQPRVLVEAGRGSQAVIVQDHISLGDGPSFTNAVTELHVGPGARLEHVLLQRESAAAFHASYTSAQLERDAHLGAHVVTLGGRLVRNDLQLALAGEGAEARLQGLFLCTGERLVDNHTFVDHAVPHGTSRQLYKGVLAGSSRGVFRGRVRVRPGAQKTDARQSNPNLLLSDAAEIDGKPQLEIHADDVKCSHGSAIGRVDENALFYLRARGIDVAAARALLVRGFAAEVLAALPEPALADALGDAFAELLEAP
jgi:Fe-S cluster assembly protein SufD